MNNKNSSFLFVFAGFFLLAVVITGGCGGSGSTNVRNGANANRANNSNASEIPANAPAGATPAHYKGGAAASVVIEEFADFQCPTCAVLHPTVQQLQAAYGDRVKIIFRNFPLQMHPKAYDAAVAAEAAGMQGKFWEMQNQLFTNQQFWANASDHRKIYEDYAQKLGLDVDKFRDDMAGMATKARVDADMARARALGVGSTPSFYMNGRLLPYEGIREYNLFRQMIDNELLKTQGQSQTVPSAPVTTATTPAAANTVGVNTAPAANANKPAAANSTDK